MSRKTRTALRTQTNDTVKVAAPGIVLDATKTKGADDRALRKDGYDSALNLLDDTAAYSAASFATLLSVDPPALGVFLVTDVAGGVRVPVVNGAIGPYAWRVSDGARGVYAAGVFTADAGSSLTPDQQAAINNANAPTGSNPFATKADIIIAPFVVRSADGLTIRGFATFIEARNAALTGDRIECYTDCIMPYGVVNEVWMPGYVLTLAAGADISANITARRIVGPTNAIFQPGNITIVGYFELVNPADLSSTTNLTLIGGGVLALNCQPGTVVTLQDGHFTSLPGLMLEGNALATAYLKNASISGYLGTTVPVIDRDNRLRSTPVVVPGSSVVAGVLDLTALPFAECVFVAGSATIDSIIGYNMPHVIRITGVSCTVNIVPVHAAPSDVAGWGQFVSGAIIPNQLRVDGTDGYIELRRKQDDDGVWYYVLVNSNRGL